MATDYPPLRELKASKFSLVQKLALGVQKLALGVLKQRCGIEARNSPITCMPKQIINQGRSSTSQVKYNGKARPCVQFCHVDVREYGRVLDDHPECKDGIALGLDWKHAYVVRRIPIELFERIRKAQGKRSMKPLERLSTFEKKKLLVNVGAYREEILWDAYCKSLQTQNMMKRSPKAVAA